MLAQLGNSSYNCICESWVWHSFKKNPLSFFASCVRLNYRSQNVSKTENTVSKLSILKKASCKDKNHASLDFYLRKYKNTT